MVLSASLFNSTQNLFCIQSPFCSLVLAPDKNPLVAKSYWITHFKEKGLKLTFVEEHVDSAAKQVKCVVGVTVR